MALRWLEPGGEADWIVSRLHPFAADVGSVLPDCFEAYARIFHPVIGADGVTRRWADVAEANARIAHPEMQLHMIERPVGTPAPAGYECGDGYDSGSLRAPARAVLVERLRAATTTPDECWFCVWEGFGGLDDEGVAGRVRVPGRGYLLASGPIDRALESFHPSFDQSPTLWWPDDRAWVVATEIDHAWTYVGADRAAIDGLLSDPRIEALEARITDRFVYDSDELNARLDG